MVRDNIFHFTVSVASSDKLLKTFQCILHVDLIDAILSSKG